jgi:hypothetical protein
MAVHAGLSVKRDPISKTINTKKVEDVVQIVEHFLLSTKP